MEEKGIAHFIKYNNTVPIVLGLIFLSTTATFAATPAAREAVARRGRAVEGRPPPARTGRLRSRDRLRPIPVEGPGPGRGLM